MEEALRAVLRSSAAVIDLVPPERINWGDHPQGIGDPYVVLNVISGAEGMTLKGPDGLAEARVQIDCYGSSYAAAKSLSRAVVGHLHGYRMGRFRLVAHVATRDSREGGTNEAERLFRVSLDFTTHWRET